MVSADTGKDFLEYLVALCVSRVENNENPDIPEAEYFDGNASQFTTCTDLHDNAMKRAWKRLTISL